MKTNDAKKLVTKATVAEDAFPKVKDAAGLATAYRELARLLHPDLAGPAAAPAMARLNVLRDEAETKLEAGTWGKRLPPGGVEIAAKNHYTNVGPLAGGEVCDVYQADFVDGSVKRRAAIKLVRDPRDADLSAAEWKTLQALWAKTDDAAKGFQRYLPRPIETARIEVGGKVRRANIFRLAERKITLAHVLQIKPDGLDARDMAWMWRRVLEILAWVHRQGVVHGAVLPEHVLINPDEHSAKLVGWSASVKPGERVRIMSAARADLYAPEVPAKLPASGATDVFMSARLALALVGGERSALPTKVANLIDACLLRNPRMRHGDAVEVYKRFDAVLREAYGPPRFRPLSLPAA